MQTPTKFIRTSVMKPRKYPIDSISPFGKVGAVGMHHEGDRWYMAIKGIVVTLIHEPSEV